MRGSTIALSFLLATTGCSKESPTPEVDANAEWAARVADCITQRGHMEAGYVEIRSNENKMTRIDKIDLEKKLTIEVDNKCIDLSLQEYGKKCMNLMEHSVRCDLLDGSDEVGARSFQDCPKDDSDKVDGILDKTRAKRGTPELDLKMAQDRYKFLLKNLATSPKEALKNSAFALAL